MFEVFQRHCQTGKLGLFASSDGCNLAWAVLTDEIKNIVPEIVLLILFAVKKTEPTFRDVP